MTILAFDTCFGACSVALWSAARRQLLAERFEVMSKGHSERIIPMIGEALAEAGLGLDRVAKLAVTSGPGSFTGVRTGIAVARGLALVRPIEIRVASSLHVMALGVRASEPELPIAIAVATRDGLVYFASFEGADPMPTLAPCLVSPADAIAMLDRQRHAIAGSGASLLVSAATTVPHVHLTGPLEPRAADLARLAERLPVAVSPKPLYLREADAKPQAASSLQFALTRT